MTDEVIKPFNMPNNKLFPKIGYVGKGRRVEFVGSSLKQDKITYTHRMIVNICINLNYNQYYNLENCLFGSVKITKNSDIDKYKYSGYVIRFDGMKHFHFLVVDLVKM